MNRGRDGADGVAELRQALEAAKQAVERERRRSGRWEREAIFRASTVAGKLSQDILAARKLANAVERDLDLRQTISDPGTAAIRQALRLYRDTCGG
jgi:hypothetical protein